MIFAHTLLQVLRGEKCQTRRIVKPDEAFDSEHQAIVKINMRTMYKVGKSYAVQPNRGKKAVARILITGIRKEKIGTISEADALDEGFRSRDDFLATWQSIHGEDANLNHDVWVIEFKLQSIMEEELKAAIDEKYPKNQSPDYSEDLSGPIEKISGNCLHSRDNRERGVGAALSDRLSVFAT